MMHSRNSGRQLSGAMPALLAAALLAAALPAGAASQAPEANAPTVPPEYVSAFDSYRPMQSFDAKPGAVWRAANDDVASNGGMAQMMGGGMEGKDGMEMKSMDMPAPHAGAHGEHRK